MSSETYAILFKGGVVDGHDPAAVQAQLARLLKLNPQKTKALFSGKQIILRKTADKAEAAKYGKALKEAGADVKIKVIQAEAGVASNPIESKHVATEPGPAQPEAPVAETAERTIDTSSITLAPNVDNLFDPIPVAEAPDLDLSEYVVAENDGSFIVEPTEAIEVEIDLFAYTVTDNDGSDLFEAEEVATPDIDVPDFGLDEPGAVLETLQEDKEILSPNTMGMNLAIAGANLIEEDEKPTEPPPRTPDTSGINLVPNFDI